MSSVESALNSLNKNELILNSDNSPLYLFDICFIYFSNTEINLKYNDDKLESFHSLIFNDTEINK